MGPIRIQSITQQKQMKWFYLWCSLGCPLKADDSNHQWRDLNLMLSKCPPSLPAGSFVHKATTEQQWEAVNFCKTHLWDPLRGEEHHKTQCPESWSLLSFFLSCLHCHREWQVLEWIDVIAPTVMFGSAAPDCNHVVTFCNYFWRQSYWNLKKGNLPDKPENCRVTLDL